MKCELVYAIYIIVLNVESAVEISGGERLYFGKAGYEESFLGCDCHAVNFDGW